jgi:hypothetical protein
MANHCGYAILTTAGISILPKPEYGVASNAADNN